VPDGVPCIGVADWCADLPRWSNVVLGRSLGLIVDEPCPGAEALRERADACPHADRAFGGCACVDRRCGRDDKIVSGLDCILCKAGETT
jgi:hypothetical protein